MRDREQLQLQGKFARTLGYNRAYSAEYFWQASDPFLFKNR